MEITNRIVANAVAAVRNATIVIKPSPSADTRSADHVVAEDELRRSTEMHIDDVRRGMEWLADAMRERGVRHDWTKLRYFPSFYRYRQDVLGAGILERAYANTQKLISGAVRVGD